MSGVFQWDKSSLVNAILPLFAVSAYFATSIYYVVEYKFFSIIAYKPQENELQADVVVYPVPSINSSCHNSVCYDKKHSLLIISFARMCVHKKYCRAYISYAVANLSPQILEKLSSWLDGHFLPDIGSSLIITSRTLYHSLKLGFKSCVCKTRFVGVFLLFCKLISI